jgi:nucleoside-triphosphatase THEP1
VRNLLANEILIGTIALKVNDGFIGEVKKKPCVQIWNLDANNRQVHFNDIEF